MTTTKRGKGERVLVPQFETVTRLSAVDRQLVEVAYLLLVETRGRSTEPKGPID